MTKAQKTEQAGAIARLREWINPGDTIHCILRHRSASGMSRVIQLVHAECKDGRAELGSIGYNVALAIGERYDRHKEGIRISGCGMDMGFALVYELGCALWPNGTDKPHGTRNGEPDSAGGYALHHHWL